MPYHKQSETERLPGLLALLLAACVALAVVTLTDYAVNEGRNELSSLRKESQVGADQRRDHIERAVECAVGGSCEDVR